MRLQNYCGGENSSYRFNFRWISKKDFFKIVINLSSVLRGKLDCFFFFFFFFFFDVVESLLILWTENTFLVSQSWSLAAERTVFAVTPVKAVRPTSMTDGASWGALAVKRPLVVTLVRAFWKRNSKKTIRRNCCPHQEHWRCVYIFNSLFDTVSLTNFYDFKRWR